MNNDDLNKRIENALHFLKIDVSSIKEYDIRFIREQLNEEGRRKFDILRDTEDYYYIIVREAIKALESTQEEYKQYLEFKKLFL